MVSLCQISLFVCSVTRTEFVVDVWPFGLVVLLLLNFYGLRMQSDCWFRLVFWPLVLLILFVFVVQTDILPGVYFGC
jgi:hypothetical protein